MTRIWVRAFIGTYVVKVTDIADWTVLKDNLIAASQGVGNRVNFIISPPLAPTAGRFNGLMPPPLWEQFNSVAYE